MGLWNTAQLDAINKVAAQSKELIAPTKSAKSKSINDDLIEISKKVEEYFKDSQAILIHDREELHEYVTEAIAAGEVGIDTETTGLDRINDTIVGASLYYPGGVECYIPMKHLVPIFDTPRKGQLTYDEVQEEFQRFDDARTKMIFANADFDLSMIWKDLKVDMTNICHYDAILAWRCLKENEKDNALKVLYNKYVLRGKGDPMKFSDFFDPKTFPYCKPEVARLYAANDAKITYELYRWQLPYLTKGHPKCEKSNLGGIADLFWNVEMPLVKSCQMMHRIGIYVDQDTASKLVPRYKQIEAKEMKVLADMVDDILKDAVIPSMQKRPFMSGKDFNPKSPPHVKYLLYTVMQIPKGQHGESTDKNVLGELNLPVTNQMLKVRSMGVLISTFVDKMPKAVAQDGRIHAEFKQIGADTGRFSSRSPNVQNIPSHATDIRHLFRATPAKQDTVKCSNDETSITVSLPLNYSVTTPDGLKLVSELVEGDSVRLLHNNQEVYKIVRHLDYSGADSSVCNVIF